MNIKTKRIGALLMGLAIIGMITAPLVMGQATQGESWLYCSWYGGGSDYAKACELLAMIDMNLVTYAAAVAAIGPEGALILGLVIGA